MMMKMEFDCKLAHQDEIRRISGFSSVKELYEKISRMFSVRMDEILYCTLNTHNFRDTDSLLGNYLSLGDLIVVHLCGAKKKFDLTKTSDFLGLTITDNGNGRAFVKKVKSPDGLIEKSIRPGDHISAINSESMIGMRHFEVAKAIRSVPQNTQFTLILIEPIHNEKHQQMQIEYEPEKQRMTLADDSEEKLQRIKKQSTEAKIQMVADEEQTHLYDDQEYEDDLTKSSLPIDRLLSTQGSKLQSQVTLGGDNVEQTKHELGHNTYRQRIDRINSILESFLGINDNCLAIQIYRLAKENKDSYMNFSYAIENSELSVFNFDKDIETYLWNCATNLQIV